MNTLYLTGCSLIIVYFLVLFLNSASSAAALVFYLPGVCTHSDTEGKQRKARVRNILKSSKKNTILNEQPVALHAPIVSRVSRNITQTLIVIHLALCIFIHRCKYN